MKHEVTAAAFQLRWAIESGRDGASIGQESQALVHALGGHVNLSGLTPGAAALYLVSLVLTQPPSIEGGE